MCLEINRLEIDFCKPPQIVSVEVPGAECQVPKPGTWNSGLDIRGTQNSELEYPELNIQYSVFGNLFILQNTWNSAH
jgi:hypothetical protein